MAKLKMKDYVKALLQGTIVVGFSVPLGSFVGGVAILQASIPVVGVNLATALAAGALTVVSAIGLEMVPALK